MVNLAAYWALVMSVGIKPADDAFHMKYVAAAKLENLLLGRSCKFAIADRAHYSAPI